VTDPECDDLRLEVEVLRQREAEWVALVRAADALSLAVDQALRRRTMSAGLLDEFLTDVREQYEALRWPSTGHTGGPSPPSAA
jgi:hypothetical protein